MNATANIEDAPGAPQEPRDARRRKRIGLTGGNGFIGSVVSRQLAEAGVDVLHLRRDRAEVEKWRALCADVDAIIHLAAPAENVTMEAAEASLETTRRLFAALPPRPVRVVFASSMALFKPTARSQIDEKSVIWCAEELAGQDLYTRMKMAQEDLVRTLCAEREMPLTILRPTNVWNERRWRQSGVGPMAGRLWFVVAPRRAMRLTHVENCARAFVDAALDALPTPAAFNLDDGADVSAWHFATRVVPWRGRGYLPIPIAGWLFDACARMTASLLRFVAPHRNLPGLLISDRRLSRFGGFGVDTARARDQLHWHPDLRPYRSTGAKP